MKVKCYSFLYYVLTKTVKFRDKSSLINRLWFKLYNFSTGKYKGPISTTIHGFKVIVNNGYMYPLFARLYPFYNNPLVQLTFLTYETLRRKIVIVDVGAAIGDTMMLLLKNCPDMIGQFYCIEGEKEFFKYLKLNLGNIPESRFINEILSDIDGSIIGELIKIHPGTASAIGISKMETKSLDSLILDHHPQNIDLIKIDVDGFDGKILKGSEKIIEYFKPTIIFEWHPIMMQKTKNEIEQPFEVLDNLGYNKYLWFTKYGTFSHFDLNNDVLTRSEWSNICLRDIYDYDYHFDIIALHKDINIDITKLAELQFAKNRNSKF